jgi:hypothetical protein
MGEESNFSIPDWGDISVAPALCGSDPASMGARLSQTHHRRAFGAGRTRSPPRRDMQSLPLSEDQVLAALAIVPRFIG